jgi:hypothetical protein
MPGTLTSSANSSTARPAVDDDIDTIATSLDTP